MEPNGEAEEHLLAGFRRGETTDLGPGEPADPAFDPDTWSSERVVRAEFVRALLLDAEMLEPSHPRLVSLAGAQIVGALRLSNLELTVDLELRRCYFTEPVVLTNLSARDLDFTGCRIPNLAASGLAAGLVELAGARTGQIDLRRARIRDDLSLDAATIGDESHVDDPDYLALYADGLAVDGHFTATGLAAAGQIRLVGARITGSLGLDNAQIANPAGVAVDASRITVEGGVYATVEIDGELVLTGAAIGTLLSLIEARLLAPHGRRTQEPGWAVRAGGLTVDGHLIADGVQLTGWTEFQAAVVRGVFQMDRVSIGPPPPEAAGMLDLTGMEAQSLSLRDARLNTFLKLDRLRVAGNVTLTNSTIGPEIAETGPDWPGLSADAATIAGTFSLEGVQAGGVVSLVDCTADRLDLRAARLRSPGGVALDASRINISHGMRAPRAEVDGAVILEAARIGDTFELIDTRLLESSSALATLNARRLLVDGDLRITDLSAFGSGFDLSQARVTGHSVIGPLNRDVPSPSTELMTLHLDSCQLDSLDLVDVQAEIDLEGTTVRRLYVHTDSPMRLSGLSYQDLAIGPTGDLREALAWLARDPAFIPQTYEQLAAFYSGQGREADAREVRLGARRLARAREPWLRRLPGLLSDSVAGYGYRPSRAFVWLLIFWLMMLGWFSWHPPRATGQHSSFNAWLYALDVVLPASPFGMEGKWEPNGDISEFLSVLGQAAGYLLTIPAIAAVNRVFTRN